MPQAGLLDAEKKMWDANLERGTLELRHKQILARIDILNQLNTQAMLVAGCAVANLSGESLQIVEEGRWAAEVLAVAFVATSALTLGCSLWVIFMSSNLIQLSQQAALQGTRAQDVRGADRILTKRSEEVRGFYMLSLGGILISSLLIVWMNMSPAKGVLVTAIFGALLTHALTTLSATKEEYRADAHLDVISVTTQLRRAACLLFCAERCCPAAGGYEAFADEPSSPLEPAAAAAAATAAAAAEAKAARRGGGDGAAAKRGALLKTKSEAGPLRALQLQRGAAGGKQRGSFSVGELLTPGRSRSGSAATVVERASARNGAISPADAAALAAGLSEPKDRRWFVLESGKLQWWESEEHFALRHPPRGSFDLRHTAVCQLRDGETRTIALLPDAALAAGADLAKVGKSLFLRAKEGAETTDDWCRAIERGIREARATIEPVAEATEPDASKQ